ncbi:TetR/AcrR family transcriptional regulator [Nannocystis punicea]|uniref:TetR/AcrR family transcriptional regulator n=1 Tax=Nannocystis punicea TaxID=2995304 RepID=A0ABY7GY14_9BACT|nr:TetR/AcrR family transcriptional regulator [Nannocystis poenicansa]WAS91775.1 TetR/AcrR family transcriptional regulator [Nannocystis poenicansa]
MDEGEDPRTRILAATLQLLATGGRDAVTTRAVAAAAGVQAPTLYRLFGDKRGLLDAVAAHGYASYLREKQARVPIADPVEDLRAGWDLHIAFGLANPAIYTLMADPALRLTAGDEGRQVLAQSIRRIAAAGRLRVREPHAAELVHAAGLGTVLALLERRPEDRDLDLSASAREAVIAAITTGTPVVQAPTPAAAAIALRAVLDDAAPLSQAERALLGEWLGRLAAPR